MTRIQDLPQATEPWEVGVVAGPTIEGIPIEGVLLVVGAETAHPRYSTPLLAGQPIDLARACVSEVEQIPRQRPLELRVADPALADRIQDAFGAPVRIVAQLPALDFVGQMMLQAFGGDEEPDFPVPDVERLRPVWSVLLAARPWNRLDERVVFTFPDAPGALGQAVATVIGAGGEQRGIVVYRSERDRADFQRAAMDPESGLDVVVWGIHADPVDELPAPVREQAETDGLITPDGLGPLLFTFSDGEMSPISADDVPVLLAAVEAVCVLASSGLDLYDGSEHTSAVRTADGRTLTVCARADLEMRARLAFDVDHLVIHGGFRLDDERLPGVVFKTSKGHAVKAAEHFRHADAVHFERGPDGLLVRLFAGDRDLGLLCCVDLEEGLYLLGAPTVAVGIAAGGAKRTSLADKDVLWVDGLEVV